MFYKLIALSTFFISCVDASGGKDIQKTKQSAISFAQSLPNDKFQYQPKVQTQKMNKPISSSAGKSPLFSIDFKVQTPNMQKMEEDGLSFASPLPQKKNIKPSIPEDGMFEMEMDF